MRQLTVSAVTFNEMLSGLIMSGVTFTAEETGENQITITFTGGY